MRIFFILVLSIAAVTLFAQTQTVRGRIIDKESKQPLIGATVFVSDSVPTINTMTNEEGVFELLNVPLGRQTIEAQYMGYANFATENLIISAAKAPYLEIEMIESVATTDEVVVTASGTASNLPLNELSVVATRSFSVEETQRYPASINDPGRMVMAFPGVQSNQDTENDIIIHGNTAMGMLWRLEGLDLVNPNHYGRPATTGGGITVFSASLLSNSDFSTGAFAAEYGNAFSGVFDMRFRKGNLQNHEFTFRLGLIGVEGAAEGPFKKGRSSFLFNYRYSTLGILGAMGLYVVAPNARNTFQDLSFNLYFASKDMKTTTTFFGVMGLSREEWLVRDTAEWFTSWDYIRNSNPSQMAASGVTVTRLLNDKSYLRVVVGGTFNKMLDIMNDASLDSIRIETSDYFTGRAAVHATYSNKISNRFRIKAGFIQSAIFYKLLYQLYMDNTRGLVTLIGGENGEKYNRGVTSLSQIYAQTSIRASEKMVFNIGVNAQYYALSNDFGIGPRVSMKYNFKENTALTVAYGMHQKTLYEGTYLIRVVDSLGNVTMPNKDLKMTNAHHVVLGFQHIFTEAKVRVMAETYYQHLFNVPVSPDPTGDFSNYWYFNDRDNYGFMEMVSKGQGRNFGIDMSVEKFFSNNFFILCSGSVFSSMFKTLKNEWRSTRMDSRFVTSIMGGVEIPIKKGTRGVFQAGLKLFTNGGLRYTPIDEDRSQIDGVAYEIQDQAFSQRFGIYFRMDGRIAYRKDFKNASFTIALDVQNATNMQNKMMVAYERLGNELAYRYNAGFRPILSMQIDFSLKPKQL